MTSLVGNTDPHNLDRFLRAQSTTFATARAELAAGRKQSHWMWFIFPQIRGLGSSPMAQRFAISGRNEAVAYLQHPVLSARLRECTSLVDAAQNLSISEIFGYPDDLKFHSSMTLFAQTARKAYSSTDPDESVFAQALTKYFNGRLDQATLARL